MVGVVLDSEAAEDKAGVRVGEGGRSVMDKATTDLWWPHGTVEQVYLSSSGRGTLRMTRLGPDAFLAYVSGHVDLELARRMMNVLTKEPAGLAPILLFGDWTGIESYDTAARVELTQFFRKRRPQYHAIHSLAKSKLVAMALAVANMALRGLLWNYADRAMFEAAMKELLGVTPPRRH